MEEIINLNVLLNGKELTILILALNYYPKFEIDRLEDIEKLLEKVEKNIYIRKKIYN